MNARCDLHIHSCLSPCGDGEMTPHNITGLASLLGLQLIALTDHNTCGNCRAAIAAGAELGLPVVPGMELTAREEAHILCFFRDPDAAEAFSAHVYGKLPDIPNDPAVFGPQLYMDAADRVLREEPRLLITAADIGVYEVQALCRSFGGVAVPAHLNKSSYSILSALGFADPAMGFPVCEITASCRAELLTGEHPELAGVQFIRDSDAHYLEQLGAAGQVLDLPEPTAGALVDYFLSFM
jgi:PHP family Zn ribbon phosphoesterase